MVRGLRELELRKAPSISETIDWARTLAVLGVDELTAQVLSDTVRWWSSTTRTSASHSDALPRLVDPNATVPDVAAVTAIRTITGTGIHATTTARHDEHGDDPDQQTRR